MKKLYGDLEKTEEALLSDEQEMAAETFCANISLDSGVSN
jgi:hypothetical protein